MDGGMTGGMPGGMPGGSQRELLDALGSQAGASLVGSLAPEARKDASLEELLASGHVSADTLLTLIESLKSILPAGDPGAHGLGGGAPLGGAGDPPRASLPLRKSWGSARGV